MDEYERNLIINATDSAQVNIAMDTGFIDAKQYNGNSTISNILLDDTEYVIARSKDIQSHFVKTKPYAEALKKIDNNNIILLIGNSGSGKSENSIMLAADYNKQYTIVFAEGSNSGTTEIQKVLEEIKNRKHYARKEIVIFDDFLGKNHLNSEENYLNFVNELIKCVVQNPNKKLILNSRKTILENAKLENGIFKTYIENDVDIIDIGKINNVEEKCAIIAMYMKIYNMQSHTDVMLNNKETLWAILNHKNFSPLIIKYSICSCSKDKKRELEKIMLSMLDSPDSVWENEIKALNVYSKQYLYILYSLSDTWIKKSYVNDVFLDYLEKRKIEYNDNLEKTISRLHNLLNFERDKVTFYHPSVIDYIRKNITVQEKDDILKYATYIEQIERMDESKKQIELLCNDVKKFFSLSVLPYTFPNLIIELPNYIGIKYLDYVIRLKIKADVKLLNSILHKVFERGHILLMHSSDIVLRVLLLEGDFSEIINNDNYMQDLLLYLDYDEVGKLLELTCTKMNDTFDFENLKPYMQCELLNKFNEAASDRVNESIQNVLLEYVEEYFDELEEEEEFYVEDVAQEVVERILDDIDIDNIVSEAKEYLCEKYKLSNYAEESHDYEIDIDYAYVEEFIINYNEGDKKQYC